MDNQFNHLPRKRLLPDTTMWCRVRFPCVLNCAHRTPPQFLPLSPDPPHRIVRWVLWEVLSYSPQGRPMSFLGTCWLSTFERTKKRSYELTVRW